MDKKISYLARNFDDIKNELINFSKKYYPSLSDNFNDASVGAWLIDLVSAVGDDLSYHTDRMYQETNIDSANSKATILNNARMNGVKIPGPKPSVCEVELSCILPSGENGGKDIASLDWQYAPSVKRGGIVGNSSYTFELMEDVNFGEQFNSDGYSNRKMIPIRDNNGIITSYQVTKNTVVRSGQSKIYKKVITEDELTPFMEIVLPEVNIMNVESIIFKETASFNIDPMTYEFYIDEEEFKVRNEDVKTYRYFEVDSLADQYRFGSKMNWSGETTNLVIDPANQEIYQCYADYVDDGSEDEEKMAIVSRYYEGVWKPISQKFITEYTDNGYLKVIFGGANDVTEFQSNSSGDTLYAENVTSKIVNNKMLGILPRAGWTMFILYRVGGGAQTNLAANAINTIVNVDVTFPSLTATDADTLKERNNVAQSLSVTNPTPSVGGKDAPSTEELKYLVKYYIPSQERCVTLKDYKARIMMIPSKYGCPFRCNVIEENNKVVIPMLGLKPTRKLDDTLPSVLVNNLMEYIKNYKMLTDYVEFKSGKIYHIGFSIDVFVDKNYVTADVILSIINTITDYFDINKHDMGEDIFVGDLERELNTLDGVISLIDLRVYKIWGGDYSKNPCPLPTISTQSVCNVIEDSFEVAEGASAERIDLDAIDSVLYADYDSMYEILNPNNDIKVRVKLR